MINFCFYRIHPQQLLQGREKKLSLFSVMVDKSSGRFYQS
jgi:hypothetical protein